MDGLLGIALTNAATASLLGVVAALLSRWIKRPAVSHALWVVVLCDLLMPPVFQIGVLPGFGTSIEILLVGAVKMEIVWIFSNALVIA